MRTFWMTVLYLLVSWAAQSEAVRGQETPEAVVRNAWEALWKGDRKTLTECLDATPDELEVVWAAMDMIRASGEFRAAFVQRFGEEAWTNEIARDDFAGEWKPPGEMRVATEGDTATVVPDSGLVHHLIRKDGVWRISIKDTLTGERETDWREPVRFCNALAVAYRETIPGIKQPDATPNTVAKLLKEREGRALADAGFDMKGLEELGRVLERGARVAKGIAKWYLGTPVKKGLERIERVNHRPAAQIKGQEAPEATLKKMLEAETKLDREALLECLTGSTTDMLVMDAMMELVISARELENAYKGRFGEEKWKVFGKNENMAPAEGFGLMEPIDVAKTKFTVDGDQAEADVRWRNKPLRFVRKDGVWRIVLPDTTGPFPPEPGGEIKGTKPPKPPAEEDFEKAAVGVFYDFAVAAHNLARKIRWGLCRTPESVENTLNYEIMKAKAKTLARVVVGVDERKDDAGGARPLPLP